MSMKKLVFRRGRARTPLPSSIELYNIAHDPYEKTNVAS
jgi:hypothetical protein